MNDTLTEQHSRSVTSTTELHLQSKTSTTKLYLHLKQDNWTALI